MGVSTMEHAGPGGCLEVQSAKQNKELQTSLKFPDVFLLP